MRFPSPERSQSPALRQGSSSGRSQRAGLPLPPAAGPAWPPCPPGGGSPAPASLAPLASTPALMPRPCPSLLPCDVVAREEPGVLRAASQHLPWWKHTGLQGMRAAPGEEGRGDVGQACGGTLAPCLRRRRRPGAQWAFPAKVCPGQECLLGLTPSWFPREGSYLLSFPKVDCARHCAGTCPLNE